MFKLTLILDPSKKTDLFDEIKLAQLRKAKFTKIAYAPLPGEWICMVFRNGKINKRKGGIHA